MSRLNVFKASARPFAIYVNAGAVAAALFVPTVTEGKLALVVGAVLTLAGLRSLDKRTLASADV